MRDNILSLCEMPYKAVPLFLKQEVESLYLYDTIYIGSEFCWEKLYPSGGWSQIIDLCHQMHKKVFFVLPILLERFNDFFKVIVCDLVQHGIDGFVVNDYGTLWYMVNNYSTLDIVIGRLLLKSARDYLKSNDVNIQCRFPMEIINIVHRFNCVRIDVDYNVLSYDIKETIDIEIGVHSTCYITSTTLCDYILYNQDKDGVIGSRCEYNCYKEFTFLPNSPLFKLGNALLFLQQADSIKYADKIIVDIICNKIKSDII